MRFNYSLVLKPREKIMFVKEDWDRLEKAKKWFLGLVTPAVIVAFVSLTFSWIFLFRIGREDLFMQVLASRAFFSTLAFFSFISITLYLFVFFTQSLILILILKRKVKNFESYEKMIPNYLLDFVGCSIISSLTLYFISFYYSWGDATRNSWLIPCQFLLMAIVSIIICFLVNRTFIYKKTHLMSRKEKYLFNLKYLILNPALLGLASWCFVFPLGLIMKFISFQPHTSNAMQLLDLSGFTFIIVICSLSPGIAYFWLSESLSISKQLMIIVLVAVIAIFVSSMVAPVIPVQIVNLSMKLSGITRSEIYNYSVSQDQYPFEMFESSNWAAKESNNKKFIIFRGFSIYKTDSVNLVCPENVSNALSNSMKFIIFNSNYDRKLRAGLSIATAQCNVINKGDFKYWKLTI